jgi:hypothetical protein
MSGAVSAGALAMMGTAVVASQMMKPKTPQAAAIQPPEKPPQASTQPDRSALTKAAASASAPGGAFAGNSGTFLTGPSGVDAGALNLGRNVLLGQ